MRTTTRTALGAAAVAFALLTTSCAAESSVADDEAVDQSTSQQTTDETADQGTAGDDGHSADTFEVIELDGALVDSFPADVPLYDGEVLRSAASWSDYLDKPEWHAVIGTADDLDTVNAGVRADYTSNGWEITSESEVLGGYQLIAHGNGYIVSITYNDITGAMQVDYGVSAR
jgi:hypothetical protein